MTNGELQRLLAKLIFTTSDSGAKMLYDEFHNSPKSVSYTHLDKVSPE